jgi:hypothetical protein
MDKVQATMMLDRDTLRAWGEWEISNTLCQNANAEKLCNDDMKHVRSNNEIQSITKHNGTDDSIKKRWMVCHGPIELWYDDEDG